MKNTGNKYLQDINKISSKLAPMGWEHSEVEDWKTIRPEFFDDIHLKNFRRSIVSGGVLNPPDRPIKVSSKYHFLEEDLTQWFKGVGLLDKCIYYPRIIKLFLLLRKRLKKDFKEINYEVIKDNDFGNPVKIFPFGVTEASIRYWYYSNKVNFLVKDINSVMEIGSGYGGLAERLCQLNIIIDRYFLVDLPETLSIAKLYLEGLNKEVHALKDNFDLINLNEKNGFILVPPYLLNNITDLKIDLVLNTMSFQHMTMANLKYYFENFNRFAIDYLYFVNRTNSRDKSDVLPDHYPIDDSMILEISDYWVQEGFTERLYAKRKL